MVKKPSHLTRLISKLTEFSLIDSFIFVFLLEEQSRCVCLVKLSERQ